MIKKYKHFINEEVGVKNMKSISKLYTEAEIYFHQDLDGVTSALAMKNFIERYDIKVVDSHIIQYGGLEYAIKNTKPGRMPVLVDFAHSKPFFVIATDHHDKQTGSDKNPSTYFKSTRSNVETISGEISPSDVFTSGDIELIKTVDSADFLKHGISPDDIQNAIFKVDRTKGGEKNRFLMGFVVNRLLLVFKNKRITVKSLDGKRDHVNKNLLECLVLDCTPSLISMFMNIKHYMNNAVSLEWDRSLRQHNTPKKLATPEIIKSNLDKYIASRVGSKDVEYDSEYKIVKQYGIGSVFESGAYDRYVIFKNNPEADFACTIFPMGLIQVSCNPFKEKVLKGINLGAITKEILAKYKYHLSNINVPISDIKRINEDEVAKMKTKYGEDYEPIGFTFEDMKAFYPTAITYLPNRKSGDVKTRSILDLNDETNEVVKTIKSCMDKPFDTWNKDEKDEMYWLRIPVLTIIEVSSGGHPSITNIQGINYLSSRKDLLKRLFNTENYIEVMKLLANEFIDNLKAKIDVEKSGKEIEYVDSDVKLSGGIANENFEYYLKFDDEVKSVTKDEFIEAGFDSKFEPKKSSSDDGGFSMDIDGNKIIGRFE